MKSDAAPPALREQALALRRVLARLLAVLAAQGEGNALNRC